MGETEFALAETHEPHLFVVRKQQRQQAAAGEVSFSKGPCAVTSVVSASVEHQQHTAHSALWVVRPQTTAALQTGNLVVPLEADCCQLMMDTSTGVQPHQQHARFGSAASSV
jgi:hypothetical protein